jgi:DNA-binding GntR family transcriptional regulator
MTTDDVATSAVEAAFAGALSKSQVAYDYLRDGIARHELSPGYRLVLQNIADELAMSVVPVREAIRRLEAEGLVTYERNVGARVAMIDEHGYVDAMQALGVVEGAATGLSAPAISAEDLRRATDVNEHLRSLLDHFDPHTFTALNRQFHSAARHGPPRLGPALRTAGLHVRLRARPGPRLRGRARPHPRPDRPPGRPARDRDRRA